MTDHQMDLQLDRDEMPTCVDIYCGAGGSSYGAEASGLNVAYGLDNDPNFLESFVQNHPFAYADERDVAEVSAEEILELAGIDHVDFLLSGPNCQAVSTMGLFWDGDERNLLFVHLARLIDEFIAMGRAPDNILIENVPGIAYKSNIRIVQDLIRFFLERDYRCAADVVNFATWGLPQLRHRFLLLATREDIELSLPSPTASTETGEGLVTVWDAISDLSELPPSEPKESVSRVEDGDSLTDYQRMLRGDTRRIHNHHEGRTAPIDIKRIRHVPPGGCWKDIPPDLMPNRFRNVRMTDYKTLYGRLLKGHPSYTIYGQYGNVTSGCFTHPEHDRPLTVREGMRLQGFPDDFVAHGSVPQQYQQIGNAVPPFAAERLINHWKSLLAGEEPDSVPLRLAEDLLFGGTQPPDLPVLTPRYKLIGYGSGTYWPKGWGEEPDEKPTAEDDYRISDEPINYRRSSWRFKRDKQLTESLDAVRSFEWDRFEQSLNGARRPVLIFEPGDQLQNNGASSGGVTRDAFMDFLAPAGSAIASLCGHRGDILVHCDFGITADWLHKFLGVLVDDGQASLRVENAEGEAAGDVDADRRVVVASAGSWRLPDAEEFQLLVLARPFADFTDEAKKLTDQRQTLDSSDEGLKASELDIEFSEIISAVDS